MIAASRTCSHCSKPIRGRTDKKFCDDLCRNRFNNRDTRERTIYIRLINSYLCKNRRILENSLPAGKKSVSIPKSKLIRKGFRFAYFTSTYLNSKGKLFHFCYEFGYLADEKEEVLVVKKSKEEEEV